MKAYSHPSIRIALFAGAVLGLVTARSFGAGTAAGTSVSNQATINFQVGGQSQTPVSSNAYAFVVDRKIDLTVVTQDGASIQLASGATNVALEFELTNTGNDTQDYSFSATAFVGGTGPFGGTDTVNAASVSVFVESGTTAGYQAAEDTATFVDELAADGTATIYIVGDFSSGSYVNGDVAAYHLVAQARAGGGASSLGAVLTETAGAETVGTVDVVFADGQGSDTTNDLVRDAKFSDDSEFEINAANLSVTKASVVVSDPTNGTTNPKAIPGAVVEYTVTISNGAGAATASSITFTDSLATEIGNGTVAFNADGYGSGQGIEVTAPNLDSGAATALTNVGSDDEGDWNVTSANTITVSGIDLAGGEAATVKFRVTVQ